MDIAFQVLTVGLLLEIIHNQTKSTFTLIAGWLFYLVAAGIVMNSLFDQVHQLIMS